MIDRLRGTFGNTLSLIAILGLLGVYTMPVTVSAQEGEEGIDKAKISAEVRERLNGSVWSLEMNSTDGGKKGVKDTLTFAGRTVSSERLVKDGYNTSNYSIMVQDDGSAVWQTMQIKEGAGRVFWRGEFSAEDKMYGMMSKQPEGEANEDFSFRASLESVDKAMPEPPQPTPAPKSDMPPAPAVSVPEPEPPAAPAVPEPVAVEIEALEHKVEETVEAVVETPQQEEAVQEKPKKKKWGLF